MPIYEYRCQKCGVFEATQRITENPLTSCPTCGSDVHRLISLTSFVLKGSGWYATDYARADGKSESSGETASKDPPSTSSTGSDAASSSDSTKTAAVESGKSASPDKSTSTKSAA